jgi:hypothetical protein
MSIALSEASVYTRHKTPERDRIADGAVALPTLKPVRKPNTLPSHHSSKGMVSLHHLLAIPAVKQAKEFDKPMQFFATQRSISSFARWYLLS